MSSRSLLLSLSFLRNYNPGHAPILPHLWSLSVGGQFYLAWPCLFSYLSRRNAARLLTAIVIVVPLIRVFALFWVGDQWVWHTEQVADGLAWGCLLALHQQKLRATRTYQWIVKSRIFLFLPVVIILASYTYPQALYEGMERQ